jgi:hypothetical protein
MPGNMIMAKAVQSELPIYWIKNETHTLKFYVHKNYVLNSLSILWHERLINTHGGGYSNQTYMYVIKLIVTGKWFSSDNLVFYQQ